MQRLRQERAEAGVPKQHGRQRPAGLQARGLTWRGAGPAVASCGSALRYARLPSLRRAAPSAPPSCTSPCAACCCCRVCMPGAATWPPTAAATAALLLARPPAACCRRWMVSRVEERGCGVEDASSPWLSSQSCRWRVTTCKERFWRPLDLGGAAQMQLGSAAMHPRAQPGRAIMPCGQHHSVQ